MKRLFCRLFVCSRRGHVAGIRASLNCIKCGGYVHDRKWKKYMV